MNKFKSKGGVWAVVLICTAVILVLGGTVWYYSRLFGFSLKDLTGTQKGSELNLMEAVSSNKFDSQLVGTWDSECLVPSPSNSKYAEKHQFIINKDGTAQHTRWTWGMIDCTTLEPGGKIVTKYKLTIPSTGKINLSVTAYDNPGLDAYKEFMKNNPDLPVTGNTEMDRVLRSGQQTNFTGGTIYDIYKISGSTLKFGHGFRNHLPYVGGTGGSEADRHSTLNDYIVYTKK